MGRVAFRDTTLPVGGGPNQDQTIYVAKVTMMQTSFMVLHRNQSVSGPDAKAPDIEEFVPEQWANIRPKQWDYLPFGGRQRACLGGKKVLAESAFVICRLVQKYGRLESRDAEPWNGKRALTAKNANGCKVAFNQSV
jgi:cytochrome P450 monooxygenase